MCCKETLNSEYISHEISEGCVPHQQGKTTGSLHGVNPMESSMLTYSVDEQLGHLEVLLRAVITH